MRASKADRKCRKETPTRYTLTDACSLSSTISILFPPSYTMPLFQPLKSSQDHSTNMTFRILGHFVHTYTLLYTTMGQAGPKTPFFDVFRHLTPPILTSRNSFRPHYMRHCMLYLVRYSSWTKTQWLGSYGPKTATKKGFQTCFRRCLKDLHNVILCFTHIITVHSIARTNTYHLRYR